MNSYSYIEQLFKAILAQSITIQGRFYLLANNGRELNTDELDQMMNVVPGEPRKFPISIMTAPRSSGVFNASDEWEEYSFTMFFLNTTYYTGNNDTSELISETQTSGRSVTKEWEAMKQSAVDFIKVLRQVQRGQNGTSTNMLNNLFRLKNTDVYIDPVSFLGSHRLSGVRLQFKASVFTSCNIYDYTSGGLVVLPPVDNTTFEAELEVVRNEVLSILNSTALDGGYI